MDNQCSSPRETGLIGGVLRSLIAPISATIAYGSIAWLSYLWWVHAVASNHRVDQPIFLVLIACLSVATVLSLLYRGHAESLATMQIMGIVVGFLWFPATDMGLQQRLAAIQSGDYVFRPFGTCIGGWIGAMLGPFLGMLRGWLNRLNSNSPRFFGSGPSGPAT